MHCFGCLGAITPTKSHKYIFSPIMLCLRVTKQKGTPKIRKLSHYLLHSNGCARFYILFLNIPMLTTLYLCQITM